MNKKLPTRRKQTVQLLYLRSEQEKTALKKLADKAGMTVSQFVRVRVGLEG
jgi:hypothetical protein